VSDGGRTDASLDARSTPPRRAPPRELNRRTAARGRAVARTECSCELKTWTSFWPGPAGSVLKVTCFKTRTVSAGGTEMDDDSDAEPEPVFCEAFSDVADMFEVGRKLGSGNFAKVIQATCKRAIPSADLKAGAQVAIKVRRRGVWGRAWGPRGAR
jgi:hypothetical protein